MRARLLLLSFAGAAACLACNVTEPGPNVTLLVTNGTCVKAQCDSVHVLAFPSAQPDTPGGMWSLDLGVITTPEACLLIPMHAQFRLIGLHPDGTRDTTLTKWSDVAGLSLGVQPPQTAQFFALPSTEAFVPAYSRGWRVTLPGNSSPIPATTCTP